MEQVNIDRGTLERFSYFMTFFEYAHKLKEDDLISRRLKAPVFDDFSNIKKRLSTVILKGLRSEDIYNVGQSFEGETCSLTVNNIIRRRRSEEELERYMQFILELESTVSSDQIITANRRGEYDFKLANRAIKDIVFKHLLKVDEGNRDAMCQYLMDNYELGYTTNVVNSSRLKPNVLNNMSRQNLPNDHINVSLRERMNCPLQETIINRGLYSYSNYGTINLSSLIRCMNGELEVNEGNIIRDGGRPRSYGHSELVPNGYLNDPSAWPEMLKSNIFIPFSGGYRGSEVSGTFILCKKFEGENGRHEIIPNIIPLSYKYDIKFSKTCLMDPAQFLELNKNLIQNIRRCITGE